MFWCDGNPTWSIGPVKITSIKQQVKRADRYSIFVDGKYSFSLSESALLTQGLASGHELDEKQLSQLKDASGADKAYGNALRYAAMRPHSVWELEAYLRRKDVDEPVAATIIQRLVTLGLLNDVAFGRAWVANRRLLKSTSKRKLRLELQQKRLPSSVIDQVLAEDEVDERDTLRELVEKKRVRYPDEQKFMMYLARQGFSYSDIKSVLHQEEY